MSFLKSVQDIRIERIIIIGVPKIFTGTIVKVTQSGQEWDTTVIKDPDNTRSIVIRDPKVRICEDWEIKF